MKRPFSSLNAQEALHVAIFIEERNAEMYHRFAEMFVEFRDVESLEIASVFWDMAVEERRHSTALQNLYQERFGNAACAVTEDEIQEMIEVPRLEDGHVFGPDVKASSESQPARDRALQVALSAEQNARKFYRALGEITPETKLRRLYMELAEFEADHVEYLEKKLEESPTKGPASSQ